MTDVFDILTRRMELMEESMSKIKDNMSVILDGLRHQDDSRDRCKFGGALHGLPGVLVHKHYNGQTVNDGVLVLHKFNYYSETGMYFNDPEQLDYERMRAFVIKWYGQTSECHMLLNMLDRHHEEQCQRVDGEYEHLKCASVGVDSNYIDLEPHMMFRALKSRHSCLEALGDAGLLVRSELGQPFRMRDIAKIIGDLDMNTPLDTFFMDLHLYQVPHALIDLVGALLRDECNTYVLCAWNRLDDCWKKEAYNAWIRNDGFMCEVMNRSSFETTIIPLLLQQKDK